MIDARTDRGSESDPKELVCTLFEGDYHLGVAALVNSLVRHGYSGAIVAGYRGELPPWANQLRALGPAEYEVSSAVRIEFVRLSTALHFTNLKPEFIQRVIAQRGSCESVWYFDPDIVICCPWSFYLEWVKRGICLCEDVNGFVPGNHPMRLKWRDLVSRFGWTPNGHTLDRYYNAGFIGLPMEYSRFLDQWQQALRMIEAQGVDLHEWSVGTSNSFPVPDQDALNIAAMYSEFPLSTLGPSGMGFMHGRSTMYHAIGTPKPWRKKMVSSALRGVPPSGADKAFLANVDFPIRCYAQLGMAQKRLSCAVGALIGRFYARH